MKKRSAHRGARLLPIASCRGKRVLIRADFDVGVARGAIADDFRITRVAPLVRACLQAGARVRIVSHRGRPHGRRVASLSLRPVARHLEGLLKTPVRFVADPFAPGAVERLDASSAPLLCFENIRFWPGEEKNDSAFAASLAQWGDLYVNEAFANCHRDHASMTTLAKKLPAYMGPVLADEIKYLGLVREHPKRPLTAILGGAKLETKLPLLYRFLKTADNVIIGGVLENTVYALEGDEIGKSKSDAVSADRKAARGFNASSLFRSKKLHIPRDVVVVKQLRGSARRTVKDIANMDRDDYIVDIGPRSIAVFSSLLAKSAMIVWNGPFGYVEVPEFAEGTKMIAHAIARTKAVTIVGGGDVIAAVGAPYLLRAFTHVSTGGGAMLAFLAGEKLPGIEALKK